MLERLLRGPEQRVEVRLEDAIHFHRRDGFETLLAPGPLETSVVDEDVETAELIEGLVDDRACDGLFLHVSREQGTLDPGLLDPFGGVLGVGLLFLHVGECDVGPFTCEGDRDGAADARVAASDQGLETLEPVAAHPRLLTMIGQWGHVARQARGLLLLCREAALLVRELPCVFICFKQLVAHVCQSNKELGSSAAG